MYILLLPTTAVWRLRPVGGTPDTVGRCQAIVSENTTRQDLNKHKKEKLVSVSNLSQKKYETRGCVVKIKKRANI